MRTIERTLSLNRSSYSPSITIWFSIFLLIPWLAPAQTAEVQTLRGHVPAATAHLTAVGQPPATQQLQLAIALPLRNRDALAGFLQQLSDPASPNYRRYLTPSQFAERFGPTAQDYEALIAFAQSNGLAVSARHPNRALLDVTGSVADIERAFHLRLRLYTHPTENRTFYAPDTEPSLALAIPVLHISGLDNFALPRPRLQAITPLPTRHSPLATSGEGFPLTEALPTPHSPLATSLGSGPSGTYMGGDFRAAYVPDTTLTGAGQTVGLVQFDGYTASDITFYEQKAGLPNVPLQNVLLDNFSGNPTGSGGEVEVSLDIEAAMSMAPGLSQIIVYMAGPYGNWHDMLNRIATDNLAQQVSCSWYQPGGGPDPVADQIWQQMAAQGQSFLNASGDYDAFTGPVDFPGESPFITQVGGTTLSTATPGGPWAAERVWNWGNGIGSGGGISTRYPIPSWQVPAITGPSQGSTTMRNIPDVALTADNVYVRANGGDYNVGGTSCAAPLWAGFMALVNQRAVQAGKPTLGFINPAIYALGQQALYASTLHDITTGNNESPSSPTKFSAVTGYDLCTGWGTPAGNRLITALATPDPLIILPGTGFDALGVVGGPFNITSQTFSLTNSGSGSLNWMLSNTSAWLTASSTGGTLVSGGPAGSVTMSLNAAASNLVVGLYDATIWFTNLNDNVGQSVPFSLAVLAPPAITNQPADLAVLEGAPAQFTVGVAGSQPLSYRWLFNGAALTDGPNISGSTSNLLTLAHALTNSVGAYSVIITNPVGSATSLLAQLTLTPSAPVIVVQPTDQTAYFGKRASFSVFVIGTSPYLYQWTFNGTNLAGATASKLTLTNLRFDQAGNYAVAVSNSLGGVISSNALLTVNPAPPCAPPDPSLVSWWQAEGDATDGIGPNDGTISGGVTFTNGMVGEAFDFDGIDGRITVSNSPSVNFGPNQNFSIEAWVSPQTNDNDYGVMSIVDKRYAPNLSQCLGYEFHLLNGRIDIRISTSIGGNGVDFGPAGPDLRDGDLHHVAVTLNRSSTDGGHYYVDGQIVGTFDPTSQSGDLSNSDALRLGYHATATFNGFFKGLMDEVSLYNGALSASQIQAIYQAGLSGKCLTPIAPTIASQPANQTVPVGGTAIFTVTAHGSRPLSYQWLKGANSISGATDSSLSLTNAQTTDNGLYSVLVTNDAGSVVSSNATLTVLQPPLITGQPQSTNVMAGSPATFSVTVTGDAPFFYKWLKGGVGISGATGSTYTIAGAQLGDTGTYSVLVSNLVGSTLSSNAILTVLQAPVISAQPQNQTVLAGQTAGFSVTAIGTTPLSYQWFKGAAGIAGATASIYTINTVGTNNAGLYSVQVSNVVGAVLSSNALLTVLGPQTNCTPPPLGLVSWWRAEGNGSDSLGINNAVLTGGVSFTNAEVGKGFLYNGVDGEVAVSNSPSVNFGPNQDFSIEGWIQPLPNNNSYGVMSIVDKRLTSGLSQCLGYEFHLVNGQVDMRISDSISGNGVDFGAAGPDLRDSKLHHVAVTLSRASTNGGHYYVDGLMVATFNPTSQNGDLSNTQPFRIGYHADPTFNGFFKGIIDELGLYNRALSPTDILLIYNAGNSGKCPVPPVIATQPQNQQVIRGGTANFSVTASSAWPLSYQWLFKGTNLAGATSSSLSLTNVQPRQAGDYAVLVGNSSGSVLSSNAVLTVIVSPSIVRQPLRQLVQDGCSAAFQVIASGTAPLSYQWWKDGVAMVGQTNSSLSLLAVHTNDLGTYYVVVTNISGRVTSSNAELAWDRPPVAMPVVIQRFATGGVRVPEADVAATSTDADADSLSVIGVSATSAAGGIVGLNGGWIYYQPPPGYTNTDTFAYTVSDGHCYGWSVGVVTVQIRGDSTPVSHLTLENVGDGSFRIMVDGLPGATYHLQSADTLAPGTWQNLAAGTADNFGTFQFLHWPPTNSPARFYRAVWP